MRNSPSRYVELPHSQQPGLITISDTLCTRPIISRGALSFSRLAVLTIGPFAVLTSHLWWMVSNLRGVGITSNRNGQPLTMLVLSQLQNSWTPFEAAQGLPVILQKLG
jgi:hypothetical protein